MRAGSKPIAQLSRELGIPRNRLYKWNQAVQTHGEQEAFPGSGRRSLEQAELMRLRRALARAEQELEILKKAEAYFAETPSRGTPGSKRSKRTTPRVRCAVPWECPELASIPGSAASTVRPARPTLRGPL